MTFSSAFELDLEFGACAGIAIPPRSEHAAEVVDGLTAAERQHALSLSATRRVTWSAGRLALRRAVHCMNLPHLEAYLEEPILPDDRGAPRMPAGLLGSISHKPALAVALATQVGPPGQVQTIGIDLEERRPRRRDISRRVLTDSERERIAGLDPQRRSQQVLLRFSLKEAVYKAIDPFVRRYVGFREVSVTPHDDGSAAVQLHFASARPLHIEARWTTRGEYFLTTARVRTASVDL